MTNPHPIHPQTDVERSLAAIERNLANIENALTVNGFHAASARTLMIMACARLLARYAAEAGNPPAVRAIVMQTLEEEFGRARPT